MSGEALSNLLQENRLFPPPPEFAARANAKAHGGRLVADAIKRQLEVAELVLTGIDEVIPA